LELDGKALLVNVFEKPAILVVINLEARTDDSITFLGIKEFSHDSPFRVETCLC
jgi:hypothetical protein